MTWRESYEYYRRRKKEVRRPLLDDYFFKKFKEFIEWRKRRVLGA